MISRAHTHTLHLHVGEAVAVPCRPSHGSLILPQITYVRGVSRRSHVSLVAAPSLVFSGARSVVSDQHAGDTRDRTASLISAHSSCETMLSSWQAPGWRTASVSSAGVQRSARHVFLEWCQCCSEVVTPSEDHNTSPMALQLHSGNTAVPGKHAPCTTFLWALRENSRNPHSRTEKILYRYSGIAAPFMQCSVAPQGRGELSRGGGGGEIHLGEPSPTSNFQAVDV